MQPKICVCGREPVYPGGFKYGRRCRRDARNVLRQHRRARQKAAGVPGHRRRDWTSAEQERRYHRLYARRWRAAKRAALLTAASAAPQAA